MSALADPVLRDLAIYEHEEDMRAAREELVEARIPVLANHLLDCHHHDVIDIIHSDARMCAEWCASEAQLCRQEARAAFIGVDGDRRAADIVADLRGTLRAAAERLARDRAEAEIDRGDPSCCELERRGMRSGA